MSFRDILTEILLNIFFKSKRNCRTDESKGETLMKRKLSALILGAAALAVGFGSLAVAGTVANKDPIVQTKAAEGASFVKITNVSDLEDGKYLIVYEQGKLAFNGSLAKLDAIGNGKEITFESDGSIAWTEALDACTFSYNASNKSLQSASGYYIGQIKDDNGLASNQSTTYENAISFDNGGNVDIVSKNAHLRYNSASNQTRFRYYKSASYTGQKPIQLYKLHDLDTKSISVSSSSVALDRGANSETITITSKNFTADSYEVISSDETVAEAIVDGNSIVISGVAYGTATITVNAYLGGEIVASAEIAVKVNDPDRVLTIAEARQASEGEVVTYSGTIIAKEVGSYSTNYYIQQGTKGIEAYAVSDAGFNIGDGVKVTGTLTIYNGLYETKSNTMVSYEEAKEDISPAELSVTYNDDDCTLVSATGLTYVSGNWKSGELAKLNFLTSSNKSIQIFISKAASASLYAKLDWGKRTGEEIYSLTGVKGIYNGTVQCFIVEGCVLSTDADEAAVDNFVATYITTPGAEDYTTIAEADRQASCVNKYTAAKAALEALTENQQSLFNYSAKYADAREIYNIWKAAYDAQNGGSGAGMLTFDSKETQNTVLISTLGAAAVVAAAGFIFLKKKKA